MSLAFYQILHVLSLLVLTGGTFYAFAAPAETRKKVMITTGIASLLMFITGFGLITKVVGVGQGMWPLWVWVKMVAWLALSAMGGFAYRKRDRTCLLMAITGAVLFIALYAVYTKFM
jgi:hypothetical protein